MINMINERCPKCNSLLTKSNIVKELVSIDAENSALKVNDKIIEINQQPIENFEHIEAHKPMGALVTVKVLRKGQPVVFLVKDFPGFFTSELTYQYICKNCETRKSKHSPKKKMKAAFIVLICLLSVALLTSVFFLTTYKKFSPLSLKNDDVIAKIDSTVKVQEIESTDYSARVTKLIKHCAIKNDDLQKLSLCCKDKRLFETAYKGTYEWRKMFELPKQFKVMNAIITGYKYNELKDDKLEVVSRLKCDRIGTIYFDYGEWLAPSPKYPNRKVITVKGRDYDDMRLYETTAAIANILSIIPEEHYKDAFFIIDGHTDSISDFNFNQALSERRAMYIKYIMTDVFNIPEDRVITKGFSYSTKAVDPEKLKSDYARNRRCEIQVCFFE